MKSQLLVVLVLGASLAAGCIQAYAQGECYSVGYGVNYMCWWGSGCYFPYGITCNIEQCRIGVVCRYGGTTNQCTLLGCYNPWGANCQC